MSDMASPSTFLSDFPKHLGFFCLHLDDHPAKDSSSVDRQNVFLNLRPTADSRLEAWLSSGGLLGVQALVPIAALKPNERLRYRILAVGPGAALVALAAIAAGVSTVRVVLHPEDEEGFDAIVDSLSTQTHIEKLTPSCERPPASSASHVLFGCDTSEPSLSEANHWAHCLQPDGQFVFFGLPSAKATAVFRKYAKLGLGLGATGNDGQHAYLGGSLSRAGRLA